MAVMVFELLCPSGHGELVVVYEGCHDGDDQCSCEIVWLCESCGHRHFSTCANAGPWDLVDDDEPLMLGDTWEELDKFRTYHGDRGWVTST